MLRAKIGENIARKIVSMPNATCSFMTWKGRMSFHVAFPNIINVDSTRNWPLIKRYSLFFIVGVVLHGEFVCRQP